MARIYCNQCQSLAINGTPCHENGCPNSEQKWVFRQKGEDRLCIPEHVDIPKYLKTKATRIQPEEVQTDYGQFKRKAVAYHSVTGTLVKCRCDIPDTAFSIPATTITEHGYVAGRDDGELEFRPHTKQTQTPAQFRAATKKAYK